MNFIPEPLAPVVHFPGDDRRRRHRRLEAEGPQLAHLPAGAQRLGLGTDPQLRPAHELDRRRRHLAPAWPAPPSALSCCFPSTPSAAWAPATSRCRWASAPGSAPFTASPGTGLWDRLLGLLPGRGHRRRPGPRHDAGPRPAPPQPGQRPGHRRRPAGPDQARHRRRARPPSASRRMHLLPYGIPLCLGFLSYLAYLRLGLTAGSADRPFGAGDRLGRPVTGDKVEVALPLRSK